MSLSAADAQAFRDTIARGGIAMFPTDTLYGIACDPGDPAAAERIYELKGRPPKKPSAVMFFSVGRMLDALPELDARTRELVAELLPGPFTLVVANPERRYAPACADTPQLVGLRVPDLAGTAAAALAGVDLPVMQTSANFSGGPEPGSFDAIDPAILAGVDLALDGGELPGAGSTVADVSRLGEGVWRLLRAPNAADAARITQLAGFEPDA